MNIDEGKRSRDALKSYFVKNAIPTEGQFAQLIDSVLNQRDDRLIKTADAPLSLEAAGPDTSVRKVLDLYNNLADPAPSWSLALRPAPNDARPVLSVSDATGASRLCIDAASGNVGLGTNRPQQRLDVDGSIALGGRLAISSDNFLRLNNTNQFPGGTLTPGLFGSGSLNVGGLSNSQTPGPGNAVISGVLGVGVFAPADRLHVDGRIRAGALTIGPWPANPGGYVFVGSNLLDQANAGNYGLLLGTGSEPGVTLLNATSYIGLRIGNAQHVVLTAQGNVGIGVGSPGHLLDVGGRMRVRQPTQQSNTAGIWLGGYYNGEIDAAFVGMRDVNSVGFWGNRGGAPDWRLWSDTTNGNLIITGTAFKPGGGAWANLSDARLKRDVRPLEGALDRLLRLRPVTFEWISPEKHAGQTTPQIGFVAQEVEQVFPEWVVTDHEGYRALAIRGFEALAVEALRELHAENQELRRRIDLLEARIETLTRARAA
jgi:hypothetical protein